MGPDPGPTTPRVGHPGLGDPATGGGAVRRLRLVLAYDGAPFSGFARQRDRRTVQGDLEAALERLANQPVATGRN